MADACTGPLNLVLLNKKGGKGDVQVPKNGSPAQFIMAMSKAVCGDQYFACAVRMILKSNDDAPDLIIEVGRDTCAGAKWKRVHDLWLLPKEEDGEYRVVLLQYDDLTGKVVATKE
eukprot:m.11979 g.11979  ORF g.11979 m.11979 type:complete len:116 (+) comp4158_c0_seq1:347-694(+)